MCVAQAAVHFDQCELTSDLGEAAGKIIKLIEENGIDTLKVAGPRESGWNDGYRYTLDTVSAVLGGFR
jgi:hypothetical protein